MGARRSEPATLAGPAFPERIGRYELLLPIGTGGMATVYLARLSGPDGFRREVALKLLHAHLREGADSHQALLEEAKVASRIRHANVVSVFDVGEDPFGLHLVMQYIEGDSVAGLCNELLRRGERLPLPVALRILADSLAGLHAAHELRDDAGQPLHVVHRDFSPQNILVSVDGTSRLTDFGIAKIAASSHLTEPGLVKGKIRYMSPEQARGLPLDRRSDVWSAGVVAWELLAGRRLHPSGDDVEALLRIVTRDAPRLRTVAPDVPEAIDEAIALALARAVDGRLPSAAALRDHLLAAAGDGARVADSAEVAAFVQTVAGSKLAERRDNVATVVELRARMGAVIGSIQHDETSDAASLSPVPSPSPSPPDAFAQPPPRDEPSDAVLPVRPTSAGRKRQLGSTVGAVMVIGAVVGVAWSAQRSPAPVETQPAAAAPVAASSEVAPEPQAAPVEAPPPSEASVTVVANAPVARVRIGERSLTLAAPADRVLVPLAPDGAIDGMELEAYALDGRRATARLEPGQHEVVLSFAPAAAPASIETRAAPATAGAARPTPGRKAPDDKSPPAILPSPYRRTTP
jgi:serine/threonine-protein kinase